MQRDGSDVDFDAFFLHEFPRVARTVHHIVGDRARAAVRTCVRQVGDPDEEVMPGNNHRTPHS